MSSEVKGQIAVIVLLFILLIVLSVSGWTPPGPAAWLREWVGLLGTVIAIVAGLKAAWGVQQLLRNLADKAARG